MPTYQCDYLSDGRRYACQVNARSAAGAARKMASLPWAPDCGPVGRPRRVSPFVPVSDVVTQCAAAALVITVMGAVAAVATSDSVQFAATEHFFAQTAR